MNRKFIYRRSALTLLEIGAFNFAREFWRHEMQPYIRSLILKSSENGDESDTFPLNDLYSDYVPNSIRELANSHIMLLKTEIDEWANAQENRDLRNQTEFNVPVIFTNFDDIVWFGDFTINYEKTAKNIMKSTTLDNWQRFSIACGYCFVEEVDILWQLLFPQLSRINPLSLGIVHNMDLMDILRGVPMPYPLNLAYRRWLRYGHPGMYFIKFARNYVGHRQIQLSNWKHIILRLPSPKNQAGCEFLWNYIGSTNVLKRCIERKRRFNFYHIFPKLSTFQWWELVTTFGASLMIFLMNENDENFLNAKKPDYVLQVWNYICSRVGGQQFTEIIQDILKTCDLCHKFYEDCWHKEIWISAPEEIKQVALSNLTATVSGKMFISRFFILVLDLASFEQREEFCRINEEILKIDYSESDLRRILDNKRIKLS